MSYPVVLGEDTLWEAGYQSGRMYFFLVQGAAEELQIPSGLVANLPRGECEVKLPAFRSFVQRLYETYSSTRSMHVHGFIDGLLITSLVLLERAGSPLELLPEHEQALREERAAFARRMAED
ncbi:DUF6086 family protein [Streptomyces polyrhachis]|uniref:DUF6086 family protein n=1 Tax=Streptomyces polyrhachis TaxID=1282885 RepID=A0ABW2GI59_9ACTN